MYSCRLFVCLAFLPQLLAFSLPTLERRDSSEDPMLRGILVMVLSFACTLAMAKAFSPRPTALRNVRRGGQLRTLVPTEKGATEVTTTSKEASSEVASSSSSTATPELLKSLLTSYTPRPDERPFLNRLQTQTTDGITAKVAVLTPAESRRFFGVPLTSRGLQAVYVEIDNTDGETAVFLDRVRLDPNYFSATEAAVLCRLAGPKKLVGIGFLSWLFFLPLALLLPLKLITAGPANRRMEQFFSEQAFPLGICPAGQVQRGFVYTSLDNGSKVVPIDLLGPTQMRTFVFNVPVPDLAVDFEKGQSLEEIENSKPVEECINLQALQEYLKQAPRAVTNKAGTKEGDPVNLVVVGDFETILACFSGARWDQTEIINLATCIKTAKSFLFGSVYRYSPVSALYMYGRHQDFALQRARDSINERLHLRLWWTPRVWEGKTVWIGQVSRDIGVRLAKTWNLTTHRIDPNVDEARDYVIAAMLETGHLAQVGYVGGVGESKAEEPRRNLTGDPYVTDGKRAVLILSETKTKPKLLG